MKFTLKAKLTLAFALILLVIIATTIFNLVSVNKVSAIQHEITDYRIQTVNASKDIDNGINQSLAALRGYMILGSNTDKAKSMKENRAHAWENINKGIALLNEKSSHLSVQNQDKFNILKRLLTEFKLSQDKIENIAQTSNNIPSYNLLLSDAVPSGQKLLTNITQIIDIEATLEATPQRKALLKLLADSRGSLATGLASIRGYLLSGDEAFKTEFLQKWQINSQRFNEINDNYQYLLTPEQAKHWASYNGERSNFAPLPARMFKLRSAADWNKANFLLGTNAAPLAKQSLAILLDIEHTQDDLLVSDIVHLNSVSDWQNTVVYISCIVSIILCVFIGLTFSKNLLDRLLPLLEKARAITHNQLATPPLHIKGNDEIAELMSSVNAMNESLTKTISLTADTMQDTSEQARSIYNANTSMSNDITQQSDQMRLIASAIEELSASATEVSTNSNNAAITAQDSYKTAIDGGDVVKSSLKQMDEISSAFDESAKSVNELSQQSQQIGDILDVIRGIAEQTNLLALNAAIEAARAGEQGRGFAVVADEVRNLASRTTQATTDVESAIEQMHSHTETAVSSMDIGRDRVSKGINKSKRVAEILQQIIEQASNVSHQIETIATTAQQQSTVTHEIASNSDEASRMSRQVSESISKVVTLAETVSKATQNNATQLQEMIG